MMERIDETIDRVASELTDVPVDPGFAAGLRDRLGESPRSRARVNVVSVLSFAAASVAIAMVGWQFFSRDDVFAPTQRESVNANASAPSAGPTGATILPDTRPLVPPAPLVAAIAADTATLDEPVAPLVLIEELGIPPVNVAPLEVANLEISNLAGGSEFEEPR